MVGDECVAGDDAGRGCRSFVIKCAIGMAATSSARTPKEPLSRGERSGSISVLYGYGEGFKGGMRLAGEERYREGDAPQAPVAPVFPGNDFMDVNGRYFDSSGIIEDYLKG